MCTLIPQFKKTHLTHCTVSHIAHTNNDYFHTKLLLIARLIWELGNLNKIVDNTQELVALSYNYSTLVIILENKLK